MSSKSRDSQSKNSDNLRKSTPGLSLEPLVPIVSQEGTTCQPQVSHEPPSDLPGKDLGESKLIQGNATLREPSCSKRSYPSSATQSNAFIPDNSILIKSTKRKRRKLDVPPSSSGQLDKVALSTEKNITCKLRDDSITKSPENLDLSIPTEKKQKVEASISSLSTTSSVLSENSASLAASENNNIQSQLDIPAPVEAPPKKKKSRRSARRALLIQEQLKEIRQQMLEEERSKPTVLVEQGDQSPSYLGNSKWFGPGSVRTQIKLFKINDRPCKISRVRYTKNVEKSLSDSGNSKLFGRGLSKKQVTIFSIQDEPCEISQPHSGKPSISW